jgi:hypothetical protein
LYDFFKTLGLQIGKEEMSLQGFDRAQTGIGRVVRGKRKFNVGVLYNLFFIILERCLSIYAFQHDTW